MRIQLIVAAALAAFVFGSADAQAQVRTVKLARPATAPGSALRAVVIPDDAIAADKARIRAPLLARPLVIPDTVLLRNPDVAEAIRALPVERELGLAEIRSTKSLKLGSSTLDLSALLKHPGVLTDVATRLQANPSVARVEAVDVHAYVVPQGLVVRSFLNYRLKPGTCTDPGRRAAVQQAGIACPERQSEGARIAGYSNPASPRYVEKPELRAKAIADARIDWARQEADNAAQVANFRAILANPVERAKVVAEAGDGEVRRLETLSDEQLTGELVATAETKLEDVMFIPRADKVDQMPVREMADSYRRDMLAKVDKKQVANQPIDKVIFLTGFTLGRQYEWGKRIEKTIKWCFVGCAVTYYAGAKASFTYGFGLRFPIELSGKYRIQTDSSGSRASLTANFDPINGSPEQYLSAGLSSSQLFSGQEFVAELTASAGFEYKLPVIGERSNPKAIELGYNLAKELPAPYANGQFTPPRAEQLGDEFVHTFDQIDLLFGYGNWGAAGVTVHPAIKVQLGSHSLKFVVHDNVAGSDQVLVSGKPLPLAVEPVQQMSSFSIGAPVYNLYFLVTPGVNAHAFIDVGVWGDSWDFPVWFPDIAIELPPGGVDFACHAGTICRRDYFYTAEGHTDLVGDGGKAMAEAISWASAFERDWTGACASEPCRVAIPQLRRTTDESIKTAIKAGDLGAVNRLEKTAEDSARGTAYGSQDAVVHDAVAAAKPHCSDTPCPANLDTIGGDAIDGMNARRADRILSWAEAQPIAGTGLADRIRVELANSRLRIMSEMKPDVPMIPKPDEQATQVSVPIPPPPTETAAPVLKVPVIPPPRPVLRKLEVPVTRP